MKWPEATQCYTLSFCWTPFTFSISAPFLKHYWTSAVFVSFSSMHKLTEAKVNLPFWRNRDSFHPTHKQSYIWWRGPTTFKIVIFLKKCLLKWNMLGIIAAAAASLRSKWENDCGSEGTRVQDCSDFIIAGITGYLSCMSNAIAILRRVIDCIVAIKIQLFYSTRQTCEMKTYTKSYHRIITGACLCEFAFNLAFN